MKLDFLLISKVILIVFIVASPFINYNYIGVLNNAPFKIMLLLIIVIVSFLDMQLAILLMVVFFILLVNFNNLEIHQVLKKEQPLNLSMSMPTSMPLPISTPTPTLTYEIVRDVDEPSTLVQDYRIEPFLQEGELDEKIKPFEAYIRILSPEDSFEKIQENSV